MDIHIKDTDINLAAAKSIIANCGKKVIDIRIVPADFNDGRVCDECLEVHRGDSCRGKKFTFAFQEGNI